MESSKPERNPLLETAVTGRTSTTRGTRATEDHQNSQDNILIEFVDIDNVAKPGIPQIDLDNVILTDAQKKSMIRQMLKSKQFWILYFM